MANAQTWVIIVKFKIEKEVKKPSGPFPRTALTKEAAKIKVTNTDSFRIDKPMLIIPNGEAEKVEVIPITEPAILHMRNLKRRIS